MFTVDIESQIIFMFGAVFIFTMHRVLKQVL
jgi:hypothetical protein